ncbi:MAG: ABC transporter substrate-binding protein [Bradyrhizobium sp.]
MFRVINSMFARFATAVPTYCSAALLATLIHGAAMAQSPEPLKKIVVFDQPSVNHDAVWMAQAKGFYKDEGLDVQLRIFPSGVTAFQAFRSGQGDIIMHGELSGLQNWFNFNGQYRIILDMERDSKSYIGVVSNAIKTAQDLKGKTVATRVGSTGSWFVSEYLAKNGVPENQVTIKNLDNQTLPAAICRGDIDGFFIWQPTGARTMEICGDKVHYLTTAEGYVQGYNLAGARLQWLESPEGRDKALRFVRATMKGARVAQDNFAAVAAYTKQNFGMSEQATKDQYDYLVRPLAFDDVFFKDFCSLSAWMQKGNISKSKADLSKFIWADGVKAVNSSLVVAAPPPC